MRCSSVSSPFILTYNPREESKYCCATAAPWAKLLEKKVEGGRKVCAQNNRYDILCNISMHVSSAVGLENEILTETGRVVLLVYFLYYFLQW